MPEHKSTTDDDTSRLRARIAELEAHLAEANRRTTRTEKHSDELARELPGRFIDETGRLIRSATIAYMEGVRQVTHVVSTFADDVYGRETRRDASLTELAKDFPRDFSDGFMNSCDHYLRIPHRVIDKFYEEYKENPKP